jgi:hypothetical protein
MIDTLEKPCTSGKKHFSPHRCKFVPASECMDICNKYPKLARHIFIDQHKEWLTKSHGITYGIFKITGSVVRDRAAIRKQYWNSVAVKRFSEIVQRKLNYEKTTYMTGHIYHRFGRVYRNAMNFSHRCNSDGTVTFSE